MHHPAAYVNAVYLSTESVTTETPTYKNTADVMTKATQMIGEKVSDFGCITIHSPTSPCHKHDKGPPVIFSITSAGEGGCQPDAAVNGGAQTHCASGRRPGRGRATRPSHRRPDGRAAF